MLLLVAVAAGAIVVGCGDDGDSTDASGAAPTKAEYLAQADKICSDGDAEIDQAAGEVFGSAETEPSRSDQVAFIEDTVLPSIQEQIDGVRALTPPAGDEETITAALDESQSALDQAKKNPPSITEEGGAGDPFAKSSKLLSDYGFEACGS